MTLSAFEIGSGGEVRDVDGRLIVVTKDGAAIGGGGAGGDPLSDGTPGGGLPTKTLWIAGADGATLRGIVVNSSGQLVVAQAGTVDVSDRAGRLLGHVTVDNASIPVTLAAAVDISDRDARLIGRGKVLDSAGAVIDPSLKGQLPAALVGGRLDVNIGASGLSSLAINNIETLADNGAYVDGTSKVFPTGFIFDEVAGTALTENDIGAARMDSKRAGVSVLEDATTRGQRAAVSATGRLAVDAASSPQTTGGLTAFKLISAATTNATSVKGSAGQVYMIHASNINAAVRYLKLYNKASAPTVGTDTPVWTLAIPGNTAGAGFVIPIDMGLAFATGIGIALTTGVADADVAAVAANEIVVNLGYK